MSFTITAVDVRDFRSYERFGLELDPGLTVLVGPNAAGKGEVTARLAALGFSVHSLSDIVREEAAALGFPPEREHLIRIGTEMRRAGGPGVLAERLLPVEHRLYVEAIRLFLAGAVRREGRRVTIEPGAASEWIALGAERGSA